LSGANPSVSLIFVIHRLRLAVNDLYNATASINEAIMTYEADADVEGTMGFDESLVNDPELIAELQALDLELDADAVEQTS
jgi:hypothetical protein